MSPNFYGSVRTQLRKRTHNGARTHTGDTGSQSQTAWASMEGGGEGGAAVPMEGGEPMSKSALKKLEKAKKAAEEKRAKEEKKKAEAAAAPKKAKAAQQGDDDEDMDPTQYRSNRLRALGELKEKSRNPYPHKFVTSISVPEYVARFGEIKDGEHLEGQDQSVAGELLQCDLGVGV